MKSMSKVNKTGPWRKWLAVVLVAAAWGSSLPAQDRRAVEAFRKGEVAKARGDFKAAVSAFTTALGYDPGFSDARMLRGITYSQMGSLQKALEDVNAVVRQLPTAPHGYLARADVYFNSQRYSEALESMDLAIDRSPDETKQYGGRGKILFAMGKFNEALSDLNKALTYHPNDGKSRFNRAMTLGVLRRFDEAVEDLNVLVELSPADLDARGQRMHMNGILRRAAAVEADCRFLMKAMPDSPAPYFYLGHVYEWSGDRDRASASFSQAIALDGTDPRPYIDRARMAGLDRNFDAAEADLKKALALEPGNTMAVGLQIEYLCQQGKTDEALQILNGLIASRPKLAMHYSLRGTIKLQADQYKEALADFTRAIELNPNDELAYASRAATYSKLREDDRALADFEKAIALNPQSVVPYEKLATHYSLRNDAALEYKFAARACELDGWNPGAPLALYIEACYELGKKDEAQKWARKLLEQSNKVDARIVKQIERILQQLERSPGGQ